MQPSSKKTAAKRKQQYMKNMGIHGFCRPNIDEPVKIHKASKKDFDDEELNKDKIIL